MVHVSRGAAAHPLCPLFPHTSERKAAYILQNLPSYSSESLSCKRPAQLCGTFWFLTRSIPTDFHQCDRNGGWQRWVATVNSHSKPGGPVRAISPQSEI